MKLTRRDAVAVLAGVGTLAEGAATAFARGFVEDADRCGGDADRYQRGPER